MIHQTHQQVNQSPQKVQQIPAKIRQVFLRHHLRLMFQLIILLLRQQLRLRNKQLIPYQVMNLAVMQLSISTV